MRKHMQKQGRRSADEHFRFSYFDTPLLPKSTGLRPIYVIFFKFLPYSFQMKNNDDMWL